MDDSESALKFEHPKWKSNLVENLTVLFKKGELCDLHIICRDNQGVSVTVLPCHACILASASPVIRKLLAKNSGMSTKLAIKSYGITAREWNYILKYVYTGSVNIQEPHIYGVWKAALYLQIDILVTVLATCIHKYHKSDERDRIPELKICPYEQCMKKSVDMLVTSISEDTWNKIDPDSYGSLKKEENEMIKTINFDQSVNRNSNLSNTKEAHLKCNHVKKRLHDGAPTIDNADDKFEKLGYPTGNTTKKRKMYIPRRVELKTKGEHLRSSGSRESLPDSSVSFYGEDALCRESVSPICHSSQEPSSSNRTHYLSDMLSNQKSPPQKTMNYAPLVIAPIKSEVSYQENRSLLSSGVLNESMSRSNSNTSGKCLN